VRCSVSPDPEALAKAIARARLNVRQAEAIAQDRAATAGIGRKVTRARPARTPIRSRSKKRLSDALGLVVTIAHRGKGGELKIRYKTLEQLDSVIRRIERANRIGRAAKVGLE